MLPMLNRTPVMVRPKEPFLRWAVDVFRDEEEPPTRDDAENAFVREPPRVYLIPLVEDDAVLAETMSDFSDLIFDSELEAWCTDIGRWPENRSWELFQAWFDWQALDGVFDAFEHPLVLE